MRRRPTPRLALLLLAIFPLSGCSAGALLCMGADKEIEERTDPFERVECPEGFVYLPGEEWCSSSSDCTSQPGDRAFCEEGSCTLCRPE